MVHFPGFARTRLWIQRVVRRFYPRGFPHSEIPGSLPACGSPRLIAACHVLLRLLLPRHPPCALSSLTTKFTCRTRLTPLTPSEICVASPVTLASHDARATGVFGTHKFLLDAIANTLLAMLPLRLTSSRSVDLPDLFSCQTSSALRIGRRHSSGLDFAYCLCPMFNARNLFWHSTLGSSCSSSGLPGAGHCPLKFGGADRDRTGDPLLAKQVLSQLSYSPVRVPSRERRVPSSRPATPTHNS
jgi:hypothetical protein